VSAKICFVANDLAYLVRNGGIGTYFWLMAHLVARQGFGVHILFANEEIEDRTALPQVRQRLAAAGIGFSTVHDVPQPFHCQLPTFGSNQFLKRSERVRHALEALHAREHFDLIEFADWCGLGLRTVQARRMGLAFDDARIVVKLHSPSRWCREGNHEWLSSKEELRTDFAERFAFEHGDIQLSPTRYMLEVVRSRGWHVRDDALVVSNPFPQSAPCNASAVVNEVVFFGRLENRKGLRLFLDACRDLDPALKISFIGKDTQLEDGRAASALVRSTLRDRPIGLHTNLNQEEALNYLGQGGRLAVIPSLADNLPYTVIECCTHAIPFLAAAVGGIPELLPGDLGRHLLFEPDPRSLRRCLDAYLGATPTDRQTWRDSIQDATDPERHNHHLVEVYEALAFSREPLGSGGLRAPQRLAAKRPLVTVAVTHYNLAPYLPEALASLATQTYSPLEVLVIDDGSTSAEVEPMLREQEQLYPQFRFIRQPNAGCGAARNRALEEARGEYFAVLDADNIALPHLIETLVRGLQRNPEVSALTCYALGVSDAVNAGEGHFLFINTFAGGPHLMASFENIYGDATAMFRTSDLRAAGGHEPDPPWGDWLTYVKLVHAGYRVEVVPACLYHYRVRPQSMAARIDRDAADHARLTHDLLRKYFFTEALPPAVQPGELWEVLVSFQLLGERHNSLRHRLVERFNEQLRRMPGVHRGLKKTMQVMRRVWQALTWS
jgi:glycosyltransferase involved in cell wall biosynthesis